MLKTTVKILIIIYDSGNDFVKLCDNIWLTVPTFPPKLTIIWYNDVYIKNKKHFRLQDNIQNINEMYMVCARILLLLLLLTAIGLSPGGSGYFTRTQIWKKSN